MWVLQHHAVHAFDMSTIIVFVYLELQVKWNQLYSNNSHHTSCKHKGSHAGKWPDLMTSKSDSFSTLGYHWTDHAGRPLEPQVHWDATGTTLADASTQWCSSGDPVLICIIGTHWKTTGKLLEAHWKHTGNTQATNNSEPGGQKSILSLSLERIDVRKVSHIHIVCVVCKISFMNIVVEFNVNDV